MTGSTSRRRTGDKTSRASPSCRTGDTDSRARATCHGACTACLRSLIYDEAKRCPVGSIRMQRKANQPSRLAFIGQFSSTRIKSVGFKKLCDSLQRSFGKEGQWGGHLDERFRSAKQGTSAHTKRTLRYSVCAGAFRACLPRPIHRMSCVTFLSLSPPPSNPASPPPSLHPSSSCSCRSTRQGDRTTFIAGGRRRPRRRRLRARRRRLRR